MTEEQINEMLAGCEGVTEGPWYECDGPWFRYGQTGVLAGSPDPHVCKWIADTDMDETANEDDPIPSDVRHANAAHIARCDPSTIRQLCELALDGLRIRALLADEEGAVDEIEEVISDSLDIDWSTHIGAKHVLTFLKTQMEGGDA